MKKLFSIIVILLSGLGLQYSVYACGNWSAHPERYQWLLNGRSEREVKAQAGKAIGRVLYRSDLEGKSIEIFFAREYEDINFPETLVDSQDIVGSVFQTTPASAYIRTLNRFIDSTPLSDFAKKRNMTINRHFYNDATVDNLRYVLHEKNNVGVVIWASHGSDDGGLYDRYNTRLPQDIFENMSSDIRSVLLSACYPIQCAENYRLDALTDAFYSRERGVTYSPGDLKSVIMK